MQTEAMDDGTTRRMAARAALVFLLLSSSTLWSPAASNAQSPVPQEVAVPTDVEAWYYIADDAVEPPAPLPALPDPVNPYGENTLHVSITGGQEETRTYVTLDVTALPTTFELVEGILTLPIDPGGVTMNPQDARVQVCLSEIPPQSDEGSFEEPPEVDCRDKAPATYKEEPFPHLLADITELGSNLTSSGLAILPSARAKEQSDTWHVTFYGKKNEAEGAEPITAQLSFLEPEPILGFGPPDDTGTDPIAPDFGSSSSGDFSFDTSTGPSVGFGTAPETGGVEEPTNAATPTQTEEGFDLAAEATVPTYTIVWALPLLLLAFASYFSSALTRSIVLREDTTPS